MRWLFMLSLLFPSFSLAACIPFTQAGEHIGENQCISGKVLRVKHGARGVTYFDFCEDFRVCPFTVVIFPGHLKDIGDVRQLTDKLIEIHGPVKEYNGRAEIVLEQFRQLGGAGTRIPRLPKNYDVENKGHYSAGKFSLPTSTNAKAKKKQPATMPVEIVPGDEP